MVQRIRGEPQGLQHEGRWGEGCLLQGGGWPHSCCLKEGKAFWARDYPSVKASGFSIIGRGAARDFFGRSEPRLSYTCSLVYTRLPTVTILGSPTPHRRPICRAQFPAVGLVLGFSPGTEAQQHLPPPPTPPEPCTSCSSAHCLLLCGHLHGL